MVHWGNAEHVRGRQDQYGDLAAQSDPAGHHRRPGFVTLTFTGHPKFSAGGDCWQGDLNGRNRRSLAVRSLMQVLGNVSISMQRTELQNALYVLSDDLSGAAPLLTQPGISLACLARQRMRRATIYESLQSIEDDADAFREANIAGVTTITLPAFGATPTIQLLVGRHNGQLDCSIRQLGETIIPRLGSLCRDELKMQRTTGCSSSIATNTGPLRSFDAVWTLFRPCAHVGTRLFQLSVFVCKWPRRQASGNSPLPRPADRKATAIIASLICPSAIDHSKPSTTVAVSRAKLASVGRNDEGEGRLVNWYCKTC